MLLVITSACSFNLLIVWVNTSCSISANFSLFSPAFSIKSILPLFNWATTDSVISLSWSDNFSWLLLTTVFVLLTILLDTSSKCLWFTSMLSAIISACSFNLLIVWVNTSCSTSTNLSLFSPAFSIKSLLSLLSWFTIDSVISLSCSDKFSCLLFTT